VPDKPFTYTAKGTIQRQLTVAKYAREIEEMYEAITQATQEDIHLPSAWTREEVVTFVHQAVHNVMKTRVSDSDDLFQNGCDR
jgi:DNA-directed RNA polymerase specialized sigma subunit